MKKRYKFAFFTAYLEGEDYSEPLWNNINNICKELDIDLYIFPGRNIRKEFGHHIVFNEILNFINLDLFDGVILASSAMMSALGEPILHSYVDKLDTLPLVSIGNHFDNVSSIFIDNSKGMEIIFDHLLKKHNIKRIAYLSGPKENEESNLRLQTIIQKSKENNVILNESDIFYGYFTPFEIESILEPLLDGRIDSIDALVCANDSMASAAIDLFKQKNINIPSDIIVTGFDYSRPAKFQDPSITTMSQSLDKIAERTINQLVALIEGKVANCDIHIEPSLVINQSCGCNSIDKSKENDLGKSVKKDIYSQYSKSIHHLDTRIDHEKILSTHTYDELYDSLELFLKRNGIQTYYLLLYNSYSSIDELLFLFGKCEGQNLDRESIEVNFTINEFIPIEILPKDKQSTIISLPIFNQNKFYGYIIIEATVPYGVFYEDTQMIISSAINHIEELNRIKQSQKLLIESEKMSFLGSLVAGLAHEINTPVGITLTAASHTKDLLVDLEETYTNQKLTKSSIEFFLKDCKSALDLILKSLKTTVKLINRFKLISVQSDYEVEKMINISEIFESTIATFEKQKEFKDINFILDAPDEILVNSFELVYTQLLQTMVQNSVIHGFVNTSRKVIRILISKEKGNIMIQYFDNGEGCTEAQLKKLFDPFYTTKRYKGQTGLGLSIIYNVIKNKLKGHIRAELIENKLYFITTIPDKIK